MERPLEGIRVLDLTTYVAAPVCGRLLADLGAEVIKVERLTGDAWRESGKGFHARFCDAENPIFDIYNTGKKCISLDLKSADGMRIFHQLLDRADVFLTNTRVGALKRLGLSYEQLKEAHPALIYAIVLGYGERGPEADQPAFDTTAFWARSGFLRDLSIQQEGAMPVAPPASAGDTVTGILLLSEICVALVRRNRTGKGDYVRSGLYRNGIFTLGTMEILAQKPWGTVYPRTRIGHGVPGGAYECADGEWIFCAGYADPALTATLLPRFFRMIGQPSLQEDARFGSKSAFLENRPALYEILREAFLTKSSGEWVRLAAEEDLAITKMSHFCDITQDEQAWANGYLERVQFENGEEVVMPSSPLIMDSVGETKTTPAPRIGADTASVLQSLGYTVNDIEQLEQASAIRTD